MNIFIIFALYYEHCAIYDTMETNTNSIEQTVNLSIRERLITRFVQARDRAGADWRRQLAEAEAFFNTKEGADWMQAVASAVSSPRRASSDRLERVVLAMEKMVGIENPAAA